MDTAPRRRSGESQVQHAAKHCRTLQHTLQHTATDTATHCNARQKARCCSGESQVQYAAACAASRCSSHGNIRQHAYVAARTATYFSIRVTLTYVCWRVEVRCRVCCSVMTSTYYNTPDATAANHGVLQCVAVCCSGLQSVAMCCSVLQCVTVRCSVL